MAGKEVPEVSIGDYSVNLDKLRCLIRRYIDQHQVDSALFWADKVVSLSQKEPGDVYWYAQCLYLGGQYHRAAHLLKSQQLDKKYLACKYLAARCHYAVQELSTALEILDQDEEGCIKVNSRMSDMGPAAMPSSSMESALHLLRGQVYEASDNRNLAAECFRAALRSDVYCYEAFDNLVHHHMLSAQEEKELLDLLPFGKQCSAEEVDLLRFLYENKLKKYHKPSELVVPGRLGILQENLDVLVALAERHYYNCNFREAYKITKGVLKKDEFNNQCLPLHIAVLVELRMSNTLFYLAHELVDFYPNKAVAWFAVGCYYLLIGKNDPARRYLSKATTLERVYGPAWLAFGHSFAAENEHDQAMAAYFTASQLMKGCHLPVLYIGLEYGLTNNTKLAERFFCQALAIAPDDPFVLHEMGVIAFQNADWQQAENYFKTALEKVRNLNQDVTAERWEPLLNNLAHTSRKLSKYEEALEYHRQSLVLSPQNPSTLSAMGYVHALMGNSASAVDYFHKALGLRRDDTFSTTMLGHAIEQLMSEMSPCEGVPDVLPTYQYEGRLDTSQLTTPPTVESKSDTDVEVAPQLQALEETLGDSSSMAIDTDMEDT